MNNDMHPLDRAARTLLDEYEHTPPHYVWDDIHATLREGKRKRRRRVMWYVAASWLVLFSFSTGYYLQSNDSKQVIVAQNNVSAPNNAGGELFTSQRSKPTFLGYSSLFAPHAKIGLLNKAHFVASSPKLENTESPKVAEPLAKEEPTAHLSIAQAVEVAAMAQSDSQVVDSAALVRAYMLASSAVVQTDTSLLLDYGTPLLAEASRDGMQNWQFGGGATPLYGFSMSNNEAVAGGEDRLKAGSEASAPSTATSTKSSIYSSGMYVKRTLSDNIKIRSGVYYNRVVTGANTVNGFEVPMIGELGLVQSKHLQVSINSGVGAGVEGVLWYPYGIGGVSIAVPINARMQVNVEPMYKHTFSQPEGHVNNFIGVFSGVSYSF